MTALMQEGRMSTTADRAPPLNKLFKAIRPSELAKKLRVSRAAVYAWTEVPLRRIADVERVSGIPREDLRPDVFLRRKSRVRTPPRSPLRVL